MKFVLKAAAVIIALLMLISFLAPKPEPVASAPKATVIPETIQDARSLALEIVRSTRSAGGLFLTATFKITSSAAFELKDITVSCDMIAKSGTVIARQSVQIYDVFPAGKVKTVKDIRVGAIPEQAQEVRCSVTSAKRY